MTDSNPPPNYILIDKPVGWTSFDVVNYLRKLEKIKTGNKNIKVGHAGTLDPFATGLLIVGIGREATKKLDDFKTLPKTYHATILLGATSTTDDPTGEITAYEPIAKSPFKVPEGASLFPPDRANEVSRGQEKENPRVGPSTQQIKELLNMLVGKQLQTPPMFSAKKIGGTRLYKLARQGKEVERLPDEIEIYSINLLDYSWPRLTIEVSVSAGTYIRTLARDIGKKLGVGGYCETLERTQIGPYKLIDAIKINKS